MPLVGCSPRKAALVLYVMTGFNAAGADLAALGRHRKGKACLYIRKLADVDQRVLIALVKKSVAILRARYPG